MAFTAELMHCFLSCGIAGVAQHISITHSVPCTSENVLLSVHGVHCLADTDRERAINKLNMSNFRSRFCLFIRVIIVLKRNVNSTQVSET